MGRNTSRLSTLADDERLLKRIKKQMDVAWHEANEVSGSDPKYKNRIKVFDSLSNLYSELGGKIDYEHFK